MTDIRLHDNGLRYSIIGEDPANSSNWLANPVNSRGTIFTNQRFSIPKNLFMDT
jgi:hypothetical protein